MAEQIMDATPTERLYALLAYASATTVLAISGLAAGFAVRDAVVPAPWQIVLIAMAVPILAAALASCGNHREKPRVRAATWGIVVPLGIINPITWLGALIIIRRLYAHTAQQHASGD